ncbi:MAG: A/G-specific adenine glycosylase, partial [bacterium]
MSKKNPERLRKIFLTLLKWFHKNKRDLPWRKNTDFYPVWVSEVMLQQTQVQTVLRYFPRFLQRFPSLEALA